MKMGWDRAMTADTNWPKLYSIPYNITLSKVLGVGLSSKTATVAVAQRLTGLQSACGR